MTDAQQLLLIEDDAVLGKLLAESLTRYGYRATLCARADQALTVAAAVAADYVILDLNLEGDSGLHLITPLLELNPAVRIVILTGFASIATAVQAIKLGASEYLTKPAGIDQIRQALRGEYKPSQTTVPSEPMSVKRMEWEHLQRVLQECDGNISEAARRMNMHRRTLQRKLQKRPVKK